ncbi:glycosyltransferase family 2 protein [Demequina sp. NBRC 110053]|uniref:glycosyltransferase family 2 protein n=1 Tax=Demequina sp. NBRC 110053 TaxID=1570342 RepID=UPI000A02D153|nr:glycosyltransferase family 2 protein [Demequina sp. NBRC 110053]
MTAGSSERGAVVVLSWHGSEDTLRCVKSLRPEALGSDILVIDNGSFDGVLEEIERRWPRVHTLQTGVNLGFAGGMNRGIAWAIGRGARTITVLNNDTVASPDAIAALELAALGGAVVSPAIFRLDDPSVLWFGGATVDPRDLIPGHAPADALSPPLDGRRRTPVLAGCCVTAARTVWERVGMFDERYFLNFEDSDWSRRVADAGHPLEVLTEVRILHRVSASFTGAARLLSTYYFVRNALLYNRSAGGSAASRVRLLRTRALHTIAAERRAGRPSEASHEALMVASAVVSYVTRRFGPAPRWLRARAEAWRPREVPTAAGVGPSRQG